MSEEALDLSRTGNTGKISNTHYNTDSSDSEGLSSDHTIIDVDDSTLEYPITHNTTPKLPAPTMTTSSSIHRAFRRSPFWPPAHIQNPPEIKQNVEQPTDLSANPSTSYRSSAQTEVFPRNDVFKLNPIRNMMPIRPFPLYPIKPFESLIPRSVEPIPLENVQSIYNTASPINFPSLPLPRLTYQPQRKRSAKSMENKATLGAAGTSLKTSKQDINNIKMEISDNINSSTSDPSSKDVSHESNDVKTEKYSNEIVKDEAYFEFRKKNNDAAKRSREAKRRNMEDLAVRVHYLEKENLQLIAEMSVLQVYNDRMRLLIQNTDDQIN